MARIQVEVRGQRWAVEIRGTGDPVLFIHGFTGRASSWETVMDTVSERFTCIAVDVLGHGDSDAPNDAARYAMDEVVQDLTELMLQLGHERFICVGYSMGGRIALALANYIPSRVAALVLESASPGLKTELERSTRAASDAHLADWIEEVGVARFVEHWEAIPLFASQRRLPPDVRVSQRQTRLGQRVTGLANNLRGLGTGVQPSLWAQIQHLQMPVLLITGEEDEKFCNIAGEMLQLLPNARHVMIAEAGHTIHLEQPKRYTEALQAFLDQWDVNQTGREAHES